MRRRRVHRARAAATLTVALPLGRARAWSAFAKRRRRNIIPGFVEVVVGNRGLRTLQAALERAKRALLLIEVWLLARR
jgi:hypothetical protein